MPLQSRAVLQWVLTAIVLLAAAPVSSAPAATVEGGLSELAGTAGCVTRDGAIEGVPGSCTPASEVGRVMSIAFSPDGRFAYVSGLTSAPGITILARDPATGALSPIPGPDYCLTLDGSGLSGPDACTDVRRIGYSEEGDSLAMTRDGSFLYVGGEHGLAAFSRDAQTGRLTQLADKAGCLSNDGKDEDGGDTCTNARAVVWVHAITLSPDERFVYANSARGDATPDAGVAVFARDAGTGDLTQLAGADGCANAVGLDEDGNACLDLRGGGYSNAFALTPDGEHAYLPHFDNVDPAPDVGMLALLDVDPATGKLSQAAGTAGCLSEDGTSDEPGEPCQDVGVLNGSWSVAVARDGRTLYLTAWDDPALSAFRIDPGTGALTPLPGKDHCISNDGDSSEGAATCADGRGLGEPERITLTADGRFLYLANRSRGVAAFALDPATGKPTQLPGNEGCLTPDGASDDGADTCANLRASSGSNQLALAPGEAFVYVPRLQQRRVGHRAATRGRAGVLGRDGVDAVRDRVRVDASLQRCERGSIHARNRLGPDRRRARRGRSGVGPGRVTRRVAGSVAPTASRSAPSMRRRRVRRRRPGSRSAPVRHRRRTPSLRCAREPGPVRLSLARMRISLRCRETAAVTARLTLPRKVAKRLKLGECEAGHDRQGARERRG